ncbi:MAG TPA: hypothetical protein VHD38_02800 [Candidatus Paceibacterota bacterium]|nr:hypothetical protein [Candidatus Paceibacterota bacterium]
MHECPIRSGQSPGTGFWSFLFGRVIDSVGEGALKLRGTWIAPVLFDDGTYGLVRHVEGEAHGAVRFDTMSAVRPNTWTVRTLLKASGSMPQILPITEEGVLEVSVEQAHDDAEEISDGAAEVRRTVYVLKLYGVLGSRDGRNDSADCLHTDVPRSRLPKWA